MTPERWRQVTDVFHAALARDTAARQAFLDQACGAMPRCATKWTRCSRRTATRVDSASRRSRACAADPLRLEPGASLGPYRIDALIGDGGMGQVYRAHDSRIGRDVAIKVLPTEYAADAERLRRFEQEARASGALNHPNILTLYDVGTAAGQPYLVMELLDGETLRDRIGRGALTPPRACEIAAAVARGLAGGARQRHRPSRSETGEHHDHPRRAGEGARLRHRQAAARRMPHPTDARRRRRCIPRRRW